MFLKLKIGQYQLLSLYKHSSAILVLLEKHYKLVNSGIAEKSGETQVETSLFISYLNKSIKAVKTINQETRLWQ